MKTPHFYVFCHFFQQNVSSVDSSVNLNYELIMIYQYLTKSKTNKCIQLSGRAYDCKSWGRWFKPGNTLTFAIFSYIQQTTNIQLNGGISKWLTRKIRNLLPPGACVQITLPSSSFINQFLIAKQTLLIVVEKWYLVRLITESSLDRNQAMIFSIFYFFICLLILIKYH